MWFEEIEFCDPVEMYEQIAHLRGSVFLDSAASSHNARFSFIGLDPFLEIQAKNQTVVVNQKKICANPFEILKEYSSLYPLEIDSNLCPFQGGIMGYFGYPLAHHLEKLIAPLNDDLQFPDLCIGFYDVIMSFDLQLKKAWIFSSGYPEKDVSLRQKRALKRMDFVKEIIHRSRIEFPRLSRVESPQRRSRGLMALSKTKKPHFTSNFTQQTYETAVKKAIEYIKAGDIYQVNLSQRFTTALNSMDHPFALYKQLRKINPAPFSAYVNFSPTVIASASPERFLNLQNKQVETKPIKGTCRRGETLEQDKALAQQLLQSEKNRAENIMIVDLMRNDLSRVCQNQSVHVPKLCELESFPTVHHLVSTVKGTLCDQYNAIDLLMATFPGGSVTGAPKIRAMEIISEIEKLNRGPYCGCLGYIGFNGDMDTSIIIRTFALQNQTVTFQVGGAIVFDSDPTEEYQETLVKGKALVAALSN